MPFLIILLPFEIGRALTGQCSLFTVEQTEVLTGQEGESQHATPSLAQKDLGGVISRASSGINLDLTPHMPLTSGFRPIFSLCPVNPPVPFLFCFVNSACLCNKQRKENWTLEPKKPELLLEFQRTSFLDYEMGSPHFRPIILCRFF